MSRHDPPFKPLSLAQHFDAPDDFIGCFGWLCGYSADDGFLDDAVERFMCRTSAQRAYGGSIALALMLDPSNRQISPIEVPGVLHLPMKSVPPPFKLLHAKVALLAFRHILDANKWQLRLIVSTGNWTRGTLEDSLDLVWRIDLSNENLKAVPHACADVKAAWKMLDWLRSHFDFRAARRRALRASAASPVETRRQAARRHRAYDLRRLEPRRGRARAWLLGDHGLVAHLRRASQTQEVARAAGEGRRA